MLHSILLYKYSTVWLLMDIVSSFRLLWLKLLWISLYIVWYTFCISLGCASFQLYVLVCCLKWLYPFILPPSVCDYSTCWTNSMMLGFHDTLNFSLSDRCVYSGRPLWVCLYLIINKDEQVCLHLWEIWIIFVWH